MSPLAEQVLPQPPVLVCKLAETSEEIEQAMRLRYEVFVEEEQNLRLRNDERLEKDAFDESCDHLIVRDEDTGQVVGTYRLLPGERAAAGMGFYSETEFDLSGLAPLAPRIVELGRSCIAQPYRSGKVIQKLWEGIADYVTVFGHDYMIGCASMHFENLQSLNEAYTLLLHKGVITDRYDVKPLPTHAVVGLQRMDGPFDERKAFRNLPPLMKGYQWLGAEIGGPPAYDHLFNTIDFFIILDKARVTKRYKRHFLTKPASQPG